jgi:DNA-binding NtrC family response regulator
LDIIGHEDNMKVLIAKPNKFEVEELIEFFLNRAWDAHIATEPGSIYQMLSQQAFDAVLYNLGSTDDFAVIRYINTTFPSVKVIISTDVGLVATIDNVRSGNFTLLRQPNQFNQLDQLFSGITSQGFSETELMSNSQ